MKVPSPKLAFEGSIYIMLLTSKVSTSKIVPLPLLSFWSLVHSQLMQSPNTGLFFFSRKGPTQWGHSPAPDTPNPPSLGEGRI